MAESDDPASPAERQPGATDREVLRVRPADEPLDAEAVADRFRRLHAIGKPATADSWLRSLVGRGSVPPTIEVRIATQPGAKAALTYDFGLNEAGHLGALERMLRELFPGSYEFETVSPASPLPSNPAEPADLAAVEFLGHAERRRDWLTRLTPFAELHDGERTHAPLAAVVETLAAAEGPLVYQALLRPLPDLTTQLEARQHALEANQDTTGDQLANALFGPPEGEWTPPAGDQTRIEELTARNGRRAFAINARAVAAGPQGDAADRTRELASAFAAVGRSCHQVIGTHHTGEAAAGVLEAIRNRTFHAPSYDALPSYLPFTGNRSRGIVADAAEAPSFCLLGGEELTAAGGRAVASRPGERTALPRPPVDRLATYREPGLTIGRPLTQDGAADAAPVALPPALQPLHAGWFGKTGSGKSTSLVRAILDNAAATDGADVLVVPKGGSMVTDYLRGHYARFGDLQDVVYFDCAEVLPAFSFFDIRDDLAAGVPRATAVEDRVDHYIEILMQIMGRERFEQAVRSPDIIRYLVKALFDPVNGDDAFAHSELHEAARVMHEREAAPPVSDDDLEAALAGVVANRARTFDELMAGVMNRLEKIPVDRRLARVFDHVPDGDDPHFDLATYLDEDVVVIFDTGGLRSEAQRVLALVVLSNLWSALRRRTRRAPTADHPLVNLYVEEAADIAVSGLLEDLLAQAREFDAAVTLSMQFPGQLDAPDRDAYAEVLNNVSTIVTGNVPADHRLAKRLATDDMDAAAVGNRLRALRRGQWLASLPADFDDPEPRPFLVGSLPPPPGHPDGPAPLSTEEQSAFEEAADGLLDRTRREVGLTLATPSPAADDDPAPSPSELADQRVDSALPHTNRLPEPIWYDEGAHALSCKTCHNRYDPSIDGLRRAIQCHAALEAVDRDDVPICETNLKLTPEERAAAEWSDHQLMFLQAVYNAQQLRYEPLAYDIVYDSMLRLQEYVDVDAEAVQDLIDAELLRHDTDHPHRLYSVTPDGREVLGEAYREGVDYGHGRGDLEESAEHVLAVEVLRRWIVQEYQEDPESDVFEVLPYYDIDERRRLDVAGVAADGTILVAGEAERINNDALHAVPADYDKLADCEPEEAIWVVMSRQGGHQVIDRLHDPPDDDPRVAKSYQSTTPLDRVSIEAPGLTEIATVANLRKDLERDG
ncbi:MAG: hypothetical protein ABEH59_12255 [Halobacteriales archaeon]